MYTMGPKPEVVLSVLHLSDDEQTLYATATARCEEHFVIRRKILFERAQFNKRDQSEEETAEAHITNLYSKARHLRFGELHDELLRDRFVVGNEDASRHYGTIPSPAETALGVFLFYYRNSLSRFYLGSTK